MHAVSIPHAPRAAALILATYTPLAVYLFRALERTGDGAAYVLQAAGGDVLDRSVHAGWLLPLSVWVRGGAIIAAPPALAANVASAVALGLGLWLLWWLGRDVAAQEGIERPDVWGLLAPAVGPTTAAKDG